MSYTQGKIAWYRKAAGDPDITYPGNDPCAATVVTVHSPTSADLRIMVDNDTPVMRLAVPLVAPGGTPPAGHYATEARG
jgi:hypothetical protein